MGQIIDNFKQLASDNINKPKQAFKEGNAVGGALGGVVSVWDVATRSGDALVQGIAGKEITDANVVGDIKNVVTSTAGAVKEIVTLHPIRAGKQIISGVSSAFQAPQSAITQLGRAATGTDYNTAA
jgi:hypothetical protein